MKYWIRKVLIAELLIMCMICGSCMAAGSTMTVMNKTRTYNVLLIGSSMTYNHHDAYKKYLESLLKNGGYKAQIYRTGTSSAKSGPNGLIDQCDRNRSYGKTTWNDIKKKKWDYVIIQDLAYNQQRDSKMSTSSRYYKGVKMAVDLIKKNNPKTQIILRQTWADYKNNFSAKTRLRANNTKWIADRIPEIRYVIYDGNAFAKSYSFNWKSIKQSQPNLYDKDKHHPSEAGDYLAANGAYSVLTGKSPVNLTVKGGGQNTAVCKQLRKIAYDASR